MADSPWAEYVRRVSHDETPAEIARVTGTHRSVVGNWLRGGGVEAAVAVRFARSYESNVLQALVAAGYIEASDVDLVEVARGLETYPSVELLRELLRRAEANVGDGLDTVQIDELRLAADTHDQSPDEDLRTP